MKKPLKIIGTVLGVLILLLAAFAAFVYFKPLPTYADVQIPDINVEITPERVAQGKKLVALNCAGCHKSSAGIFEGKYFPDADAEAAFGKIHTPNITQHQEYGIGKYSDGELYRLLRTGVKKNNQMMLPLMPQWVLASDEDIYAIIAYLKSDDKAVKASEKRHPDYKPTFLAKALLNFVFRPQPYTSEYPEAPTLSDSIALGEYLVNAAYGCYWCHSQGLDTWNLQEPQKTPGYLGGGTVFRWDGHQIITPGLLMDGHSDISNWSRQDFLMALKFGQRKGKPAYREPMKPYALLDTTEVHAIYDYLKFQSAVVQ